MLVLILRQNGKKGKSCYKTHPHFWEFIYKLALLRIYQHAFQCIELV